MNLDRFVVAGVDQKKDTFATYTARHLLPASGAFITYKKLGLTPVFIDLCRVLSFYTPSTHRTNDPLFLTTPTEFNPTMLRLPRWLVLVQQPNVFAKTSYAGFPTIIAATNYALDLSKRGVESAVISLNNGLMTHKFAKNLEKVPNRVDRDVSGVPIHARILPAQFMIMKNNKVVFGTNSLSEAYQKAKTLLPCVIMDNDNDVNFSLIQSEVDNWKWLTDREKYLAWERRSIEAEVKKCYPEHDWNTPAKLIFCLKKATIRFRRSGQTSWDCAAELEV